MKINAVYPGTFDPLTNGHLDIIKRCIRLFGNITILLAKNSQKKTFFSLNERLEQVHEAIEQENLIDHVTVDCFKGLLVNYCKQKNINAIVRGMRPLVDFEYEFEMAMTNRELSSEIETVFIITDQNYFYLRSTLIKDIVKLGGDISDKVPPNVLQALQKKLLIEKDIEN